MKYTLIVLLFALVIVACAPQEPRVMSHDEHNMHMGDHAMAPVTSEEQFIVEMIPHHQEAVDTSRVIVENTDNEELRDLAQRIIVAQEQEIAMMQAWLDQDFDGGYDASYQDMMPDLERYQGVDQDNAYLHGMIMHHIMAVEMAEQVLELNPSERVRTFAEAVIAVQTAEIDEMYGLMRH